ncbi:MAG: 4-hydroxy-3-methylbut-2-enyl diphosphate reductase [Propionibacteriaceae bacterium]|nr:4-hydroxy-3-methylbut-2-enyl diphosphate reductase [Propionibacteriaceae bacterium]
MSTASKPSASLPGAGKPSYGAERRVIVVSPRGYCAGVDRAVATVERALAIHGRGVYVRKEIVHNKHVVADLRAKGAIFVDEVVEVPRGAVVVFSAHGVSPAVRAAAAERELTVIDATCPLVNKVHKEAKRLASAGTEILLIGHAGHEEVEGTYGEAPDHIHLVEHPGDVDGVVLGSERTPWVGDGAAEGTGATAVVSADAARLADAAGMGSAGAARSEGVVPEGATGGSASVGPASVGPASVTGGSATVPKVAWLSQTTLSVDETRETVARLRQRFPDLIDPPSDDICYATQNRQAAVREVAAQCDCMLVVGSGNSSNSRRLVEVALAAGARCAHLIDDVTQIDPQWLAAVRTVAVTSGASVPEHLVNEVVDYLCGSGFTDVVEHQTVQEKLTFSLPPQVREPIKA